MQEVDLYVVVWEPKRGGGGGHQVALTRDRAEVVHRAVSRALPDAECRIEAVEGYVPPGEEQRQERRPDRRRRAAGGREGRRRG
jgi:hypothetical protein